MDITDVLAFCSPGEMVRQVINFYYLFNINLQRRHILGTIKFNTHF